MNSQNPISPSIVTDTHTLKARIMSVYGQLDACESLEPNSHTDTLFTELVSLVLKGRNHQCLSLFSEHEILRIRTLATEGEFLLEKQWAEKIRTSATAWETLKSFPYYKNYLEMAALEYPFLAGSNILFVGSGPLPLSLIVLAHEYGLSCVGVERDFEAWQASVHLINALGLESLIQILNQDIVEIEPVPGSVVVLGAMVGDTLQQKKEYMHFLSECCAPGTTIMVRTAEDLAQLLYATLPQEPEKCLRFVDKIFPPPSVVNSLTVFRT